MQITPFSYILSYINQIFVLYRLQCIFILPKVSKDNETQTEKVYDRKKNLGKHTDLCAEIHIPAFSALKWSVSMLIQLIQFRITISYKMANHY